MGPFIDLTEGDGFHGILEAPGRLELSEINGSGRDQGILEASRARAVKLCA